jgi:hypothetical protein
MYTIILHFLVEDAFRDHCFFWQQNKKQREILQATQATPLISSLHRWINLGKKPTTPSHPNPNMAVHVL